MKVNVSDYANPSDKQIEVLYGLTSAFAAEYSISLDDDSSASEAMSDALLYDDRAIQTFTEWAKNTYGLTIKHFEFGHEDAIVAIGYEITEDEHLTKFILTL